MGVPVEAGPVLSFEVPGFLCSFGGPCFDGEGVSVVFDGQYLRVAGRGLEGLEGFMALEMSILLHLVVDADPVDSRFVAGSVADGVYGVVLEFF